MKRKLKIGAAALIGLVVMTLFTLRLTGLEPEFLDPTSEEFKRNNMVARTGLWLKGEVVREPVTDWSNRTGKPRWIQLETRTWYGIPHSLTVNGDLVHNGTLYIGSQSDPSRMHIPFPHDKVWTRNVARDPRVRLKIDGKIYEAMLVPITDRAEAAAVLGRDPVFMSKGQDGKEYASGVRHVYRVYQMNISDYSEEFQGVHRQDDPSLKQAMQ